MAPTGSYGIVPPATNYAGSLPISSLGQQALTQGLSAAGPYTALLGSQMQPLLPPGVLPHGQFPQGFAGTPLGTLPQMAATAHKKRQSEIPPLPSTRAMPVQESIRCLGQAFQTESNAPDMIHCLVALYSMP